MKREKARHMYNIFIKLRSTEQEKERKEESYAIDPKGLVDEERNRSMIKQDLYQAVECGKLERVLSILQKENVGITDSISINGNSALHIAVSNSDGFLKSMLDLLPSDIPLTDVQNKDGSTLLHLAVSHGNTNVAKILVDWSRDLLNAKDNQGFTPLDIILSQPMNKEMCLFLMTQQAPTMIAANEPLLNIISYKHFGNTIHLTSIFIYIYIGVGSLQNIFILNYRNTDVHKCKLSLVILSCSYICVCQT